MATESYTIIGAGPTGLTLALLLSKYNHQVILIEKHSDVGGCHAVYRENELFSEHGPRIYISNYFMFKRILQDLDKKFEDLYTPYNFGLSDMIKSSTKNMSFYELLKLGSAFLFLNNSYKNIALVDYVNNFSNESKDFIDRICRLVDGGGIENFTLYSFLQILNQNMMYQVHQPKEPNDKALFRYWKDKLIQNNVRIILNADVMKFETNNNKITSIICNNEKIQTDNYILAMPPYSISQLLIKNKNILNAFGNNFIDWSIRTNYITYIPVVFHWKTKLNLEKIWGFPESDWGIGHIVLSDYMNFDDVRSQTVISSLITRQNISSYLNKTPNEISDKQIIIDEIFRQLSTIYKNLPKYDYAIMSQNYYENNIWKPVNTAFMTTKYGYVPQESEVFDNLYNCGVQNGLSSYSFTSMESSIVNAIAFVHKKILNSREDYKIKEITTIRYLIFMIILIFIFVLLLVWCIW